MPQQLPLKLMREDRFPKIWVASPENRDLQQSRNLLIGLRFPDSLRLDLRGIADPQLEA